MSTITNSVNITTTDQVAPGTLKSFTVNGKEILIANIGGKFYAMNNKCTHMGGDLSKGQLEGTTVTCPRHGSKFDVTTGKNLSGPSRGLFKPKNVRDEPAYEVVVDGNNIKIKM